MYTVQPLTNGHIHPFVLCREVILKRGIECALSNKRDHLAKYQKKIFFYNTQL